MKSVELFRKGKVWHYRFAVDGVRRQRSTRETTHAKAQQVAQDAFQAAVLRSRGEEPEPTLGQLVGLWIEAHAPILSDDRITTMQVFGRLHIPTLADLPLRQLTTARVEEARALYLESHARSSANTWLACLRALVGWAKERKMVREIPWRVKKLKVHKVAKAILPTGGAPAWIRAVNRAAGGDEGIMLTIAMMLGMGLRLNEALGARWEWLDIARGTYTPSRTKGFEAWPRMMPPELLRELANRALPSGLIIPIRPVHPVTDRTVRAAMAKANQACGLVGITPHRLRATYATWLSEQGVPIQDIQRALGHKDPRTTLGYLEVSLDRVARAQASIASILESAGRKSGEHPTPDAHETSSWSFLGRMSGSERS